METKLSPSSCRKVQQCTSCGLSGAGVWCVQCAEALCEQCESAHRRVKMTRGHCLQDLPQEGFPQTGPAAGFAAGPAAGPAADPAAGPTVGPAFCRIHRREPIQLFCFSCSQLTCRDCQLMDHRNHRFQFVGEAVEKQREQLDVLVLQLKVQTDKARHSLLLIDARIQSISEHKTIMKLNLKRVYEAFLQSVKKRVLQLAKLTTTVYQVEEEDLGRRKVALQKLREQQDLVAEGLEKARRETDLRSLLLHKDQVETQVKDLLSQDTTPPQTMKRPSLEAMQSFCDSACSFGRVSVTTVPFSSSPTQSHWPLLQPSGSTARPPYSPVPIKPRPHSSHPFPPYSSSSCAEQHVDSIQVTPPPPAPVDLSQIVPHPTSCSQVAILPVSLMSSTPVNNVTSMQNPTAGVTFSQNPLLQQSCYVAPTMVMLGPPVVSHTLVLNQLPSALSTVNAISTPFSQDPSAAPVVHYGQQNLAPLYGVLQPLGSNLQTNPVKETLPGSASTSLPLMATTHTKLPVQQDQSSAPQLQGASTSCKSTEMRRKYPLIAETLLTSSSNSRNISRASASPPPPPPLPLPSLPVSPDSAHTASDPQSQLPTPTVKALADSACDAGAPGDRSLGKCRTAENEPSSTVPVVEPPAGLYSSSTVLEVEPPAGLYPGSTVLEVEPPAGLYPGSTVLEVEPPAGLYSSSTVPEVEPPAGLDSRMLAELSYLWDDICAPVSSDNESDEVEAAEDGQASGTLASQAGGGSARTNGCFARRRRSSVWTRLQSVLAELPPRSQETMKCEAELSSSQRLKDSVQSPQLKHKAEHKTGSGPMGPSQLEASMQTDEGGSGPMQQNLLETSSLNRIQPVVSLFRLPISSLHPDRPLPCFLLHGGNAEEDLYLEEVDEGADEEDQSQDDEVEPEAPETPPLLQSLCAVCHSENSTTCCSQCGRCFHERCHIPPGSFMSSGWICSLCLDPLDPRDPYAPLRPASLCLSQANQRRCEHLLLWLLCRDQVWPPEAFRWVQKRLSHQRRPPYRTSSEFVSDVWQLLDTSQSDTEAVLIQEAFRKKLLELFGAELHPSLTQRCSPALQGSGVTTGPELKLKETRKRLRDFLDGTRLPAKKPKNREPIRTRPGSRKNHNIDVNLSDELLIL